MSEVRTRVKNATRTRWRHGGTDRQTDRRPTKQQPTGRPVQLDGRQTGKQTKRMRARLVSEVKVEVLGASPNVIIEPGIRCYRAHSKQQQSWRHQRQQRTLLPRRGERRAVPLPDTTQHNDDCKTHFVELNADCSHRSDECRTRPTDATVWCCIDRDWQGIRSAA